MHGAGNDYVFVDGFESDVPENPSAFVRQIVDRHCGIGADGLILMRPPQSTDADVQMQMWNADGSEGAMCGNGARCVALWMSLQDRVADEFTIETKHRNVVATFATVDRNRRSGNVTIDMGVPEFDDSVLQSEQPLKINVGGVNENTFFYSAISMGNPHAVIFRSSLSDRIVRQVGAAIEQHDAFDDGTNVEWVQVLSEHELRLRVWERGSGETQACGSGACAAVVASILRGQCKRDCDIRVQMNGGILTVNWTLAGNVLLSGPAAVSFIGEWLG